MSALAKLGAALLLSLLAWTAWAQPLRFQEGEHYQSLSQPMRLAPDSKGEVVELFSYRCPHCFSFEPTVKQWLQTKPDDVEFIRIPVGFGRPSWDLMARAYYAAEELDVADKMDEPIFAAIHVQNQSLSSPEEIAELFAQHGVSQEDFLKAFNSFAVETKMRRGIEILRRYEVRGVPMLVVNGEFAITGQMAGSNQRMFQIADFLLQQGS